jgi:hypothetical protein
MRMQNVLEFKKSSEKRSRCSYEQSDAASSETRESLSALQSKNEILQNILSDPIMRRRWELYCKEYHYAAGIVFDEVLGRLSEIVNKE